MSRKQHEAIIRQYVHGWETGDPSVFEQVLAPDFVDCVAALALAVSDREYLPGSTYNRVLN